MDISSTEEEQRIKVSSKGLLTQECEYLYFNNSSSKAFSVKNK